MVNPPDGKKPVSAAGPDISVFAAPPGHPRSPAPGFLAGESGLAAAPPASLPRRLRGAPFLARSRKWPPSRRNCQGRESAARNAPLGGRMGEGGWLMVVLGVANDSGVKYRAREPAPEI